MIQLEGLAGIPRQSFFIALVMAAVLLFFLLFLLITPSLSC